MASLNLISILSLRACLGESVWARGGGDEKNLVNFGGTFTATLSGATQIRVAIVIFSSSSSEAGLGGGVGAWGGGGGKRFH